MSSVTSRLYDRLPVPLQNTAVSAKGLVNRYQRFGPFYWRFREILDARTYSNLTLLRELQDEQFVRLVRFAERHSPFYRAAYAEIDLSEVRGVRDAHLLPVLTKEVARKSSDVLRTNLRERSHSGTTSGTTGTPFQYTTYDRDLQWRLAYLDSFKARHGFENLRMKRASFASPEVVPSVTTSNYWRDNIPNRQRFYSTYHLNGETVGDFAKNLAHYSPQSIDGYPSAIGEVARYMLATGLRWDNPPIAVFTTAETLYETDRRDIEAAFETMVFDQYASSEGAPFVVMCREGNRHYCLDTGVIEQCKDGQTLVTGFATRGTPLIRYAIGDAITLAPDSLRCACGSALPLVERIDGRTKDHIIGANGHRIPAVLLSLESQEFRDGIRAMQFVQTTPGVVTVRVEIADGYTVRMEEIIRDKLAFSLGSATLIDVDPVDHIERTASGKFQLVVNQTSTN